MGGLEQDLGQLSIHLGRVGRDLDRPARILLSGRQLPLRALQAGQSQPDLRVAGVVAHRHRRQVGRARQLRLAAGFQRAAEEPREMQVFRIQRGGTLGEGDGQAVLAAPLVERGQPLRIGGSSGAAAIRRSRRSSASASWSCCSAA